MEPEQGLKTGRSSCVTGFFRNVLVQWKDYPGEMIPGKTRTKWLLNSVSPALIYIAMSHPNFGYLFFVEEPFHI